MANYYKLITYVEGGADFETHEKLISLESFRQFQKAIAEGNDFLMLEDRVIKVKSIKEILPADDIVNEHLKTGLALKDLGLKEAPKLEGERKSTFLGGGFQRLSGEK